MDKNTKVVFAIVVIVLLVGAGFFAYTNMAKNDSNDSAKQENTTSNNEMASDFTAKRPDGSNVNLSSYFGKPTVVNFWASWSPECVAALPEFQKVYEEMGSDINIIMLNVTDGEKETEDIAKKYIADAGYTFTVLYDINGEAVSEYGVITVPETFFINAKGELISQGSGQLDVDLIKMGIGMITK